MTPKQRRFIAEYIVDHNGTQAAIRAGYAPKAAHVLAAKLVSKAKVRREIAKLEEKHWQQLDASAAKIRARLVLIAFGELADEKIAVRDQVRALELLARLKAMFPKDDLPSAPLQLATVVNIIHEQHPALPAAGNGHATDLTLTRGNGHSDD